MCALPIFLLFASRGRHTSCALVGSSDVCSSDLVGRGIYPFGGVNIRFPREVGWGNAMRWILTGEAFDVQEAFRIGLVQEVVPTGAQLHRAMEIARQIGRASCRERVCK